MSKAEPPSTSPPIRASPSSSSSTTDSYPSPEDIPSFTQYAQVKHYGSLTLFLLAPVLLALPPRKLDFYTFGLAGVWTVSANQLVMERNAGRGILESLGRRAGAEGEGGDGGGGGESMPENKSGNGPVTVEPQKQREPFTKIGAGREGLEVINGDGRKANQVQEAVEEDYWGYIKRQIREVWRVDDTGETKTEHQEKGDK